MNLSRVSSIIWYKYGLDQKYIIRKISKIQPNGVPLFFLGNNSNSIEKLTWILLLSADRDSIFREVIEADNQLPGNSKNSNATSVVVTDEEFYIEPIGASFK